MKLRFKILNWDKPSTKIIITVFTALFVLSGYFIFYINYSFLHISEAQNLEKLRAVANTLALQINGDEHEYLVNTYKNQGDISTNHQDSIYFKNWKKINNAYHANKLTSEISTLVWDDEKKYFHYILNSTDTPYFRDPYKDFHQEFKDNYETGNIIHSYKDEFGNWLTAFAPIKNGKGKVVGILEVDEKFDLFIAEARKKVFQNLMISVAIFLITVLVLLRYIRVIMYAEEESKKIIEESHIEISQKNKDILDSINYAKKIQNAILPPLDEIEEAFPNSFVLYKPKDIVSGDFYYFAQKEGITVIASADCTGHGVPGALMSMIGIDILNNIIHDRRIFKPSDVLDNLHAGVIKLLKQDGKFGQTKDGMDIALLSFNTARTKLEYAGAYRPLYIVRDKAVIEFKANKFPIGNVQQERSNFINNEIELQKGDSIYFFTDGYADQFGGPKGKKFMVKKFQELLIEIADKTMEQQKHILDKNIEDWKGLMEQIDDILVIGIKVD